MKFKHMLRLILLSVFAISLLSSGMSYASEDRVSGFIQDGYRILDVLSSKDVQAFTAYRGDYIKFRLPKDISGTAAVFPLLNESKPLTHDLETTAYFKMKQTGVYPFTIGAIQGEITVIEYEQAKYQELSAQEADQYIEAHHPIILDVRTPGEYKKGHLKNSVLIPVQELQTRMGELDGHKGDTILIYCATGNRSTVASKILIDAGFTRILNLRHGIADWVKHQYSIEQ